MVIHGQVCWVSGVISEGLFFCQFTAPPTGDKQLCSDRFVFAGPVWVCSLAFQQMLPYDRPSLS